MNGLSILNACVCVHLGVSNQPDHRLVGAYVSAVIASERGYVCQRVITGKYRARLIGESVKRLGRQIVCVCLCLSEITGGVGYQRSQSVKDPERSTHQDFF